MASRLLNDYLQLIVPSIFSVFQLGASSRGNLMFKHRFYLVIKFPGFFVFVLNFCSFLIFWFCFVLFFAVFWRVGRVFYSFYLRLTCSLQVCLFTKAKCGQACVRESFSFRW